MKYETEWNQWKDKLTLDSNLAEAIKKVKDKHVEELFKNNLVFKNGGINGKFGVGPNRINEFTIATATQAFSIWLLKNDLSVKTKGVVIGHDGRSNSTFYTEIVMRVLSHYGIKAFLFKGNKPNPTSVVSFAVNRIKASAAIIVTGSNSPKDFNGLKVLNTKGFQIRNTTSNEINKIMQSLDPTKAPYGLLRKSYIVDKLIKDYIDLILANRLRPNDQKQLKILYSPLNGAGRGVGPKILQKMDFNYRTMKKSMEDNPNLYGTKSLNPEEPQAYSKLFKSEKNYCPDIFIITDFLGEKFGVAHKNKMGVWIRLTGAQISAIILNYLLKNNKQVKGCVIQSKVSSVLIKKIALNWKLDIVETHIGFKGISQSSYDNSENLIMAWEESNGFLFDTNASFARDAFQAMILIVEAINYLKTQNLTVSDELKHLSKKYGYHFTEKLFKELEGEVTARLLSELSKTKKIDHQKVIDVDVYKSKEDKKRNEFVKLTLESDSWLAIRSLQNENKTTIYYESINQSKRLSRETMKFMQSFVNDKIIKIKKHIRIERKQIKRK